MLIIYTRCSAAAQLWKSSRFGLAKGTKVALAQSRPASPTKISSPFEILSVASVIPIPTQYLVPMTGSRGRLQRLTSPWKRALGSAGETWDTSHLRCLSYRLLAFRDWRSSRLTKACSTTVTIATRSGTEQRDFLKRKLAVPRHL